MRCTGPRCGDADAELARKLRVGARHERRHLLVPGLHEANPGLRPVHGTEHAVDAVAGVTEDMADPPLMQTLDDEVGDGVGHCGRLPVSLH